MKQNNFKIGLFHFLIGGLLIPTVLSWIIINRIQDFNVTILSELGIKSLFLFIGVAVSSMVVKRIYQIQHTETIIKEVSIVYIIWRIVADFFHPLFMTFGFGGSWADLPRAYQILIHPTDFAFFFVLSIIFYASTRFFYSKM